MFKITLPSSEIKDAYEDSKLYSTLYGAMTAEYSGVLLDLYRRSKNSDEIALSHYEHRTLLKIYYLLKRRISE